MSDFLKQIVLTVIMTVVYTIVFVLTWMGATHLADKIRDWADSRKNGGFDE